MNSHHSPTIQVPIKVPIRVTVNHQGRGAGPGEIGVSRMEGFSVVVFMVVS